MLVNYLISPCSFSSVSYHFDEGEYVTMKVEDTGCNDMNIDQNITSLHAFLRKFMSKCGREC